MRTTTAHYGFVQPEVDVDDAAVWPTLLNNDLDAIDAAIQTVEDLVTAAQAKADTAYTALTGVAAPDNTTPMESLTTAPSTTGFTDFTPTLATGELVRMRVPSNTQGQIILGDIMASGQAKVFSIALSVDLNAAVKFVTTTGVRMFRSTIGEAFPITMTFGGKNTYVIRLIALRVGAATVWIAEMEKYPQANL